MRNWNGLKPIGDWIWKPIKKKKKPPEPNLLSKKERQSIERLVQKHFNLDQLL